jgi:exodeoxyribonuclease V gamma subunit
MENLLDALAGVLTRPLSSPFAAEVIVMQSKGMQRWLSMELARRFGVWANCSYPFPNSSVTQLFSRILPDFADTGAFSPDVMTWKLFGLLPDYLGSEAFTPLQHYLADDRDDIKRFQLARKIADTFDQYTLYRPDMLQNWEKQGSAEKDEAWQAMLWKELAASGSGQHRGRLKEQFCSRLATHTVGDDGLPERVSVFGISYLPAYHLEVMAAAAGQTEVNLFLLSPTREYWADIVSSRAMASLSPEERNLRIEGNPLLASLGKLGRDFSAMTIELGSLGAREQDLYEEPVSDCLLGKIQSDILNLTGAEEGRVKELITTGDNSVQIHSCHSPMREVEVLYDQLLSLLEQDSGLEPRDILVMTPDIETYAPYITAVFDGVRDQARRIPYSIADRRLASEGEVASALIQLMALPGSRLTVVQLLDILSLSPVRRRYGLGEADLATIRDWLEKTRVRWGLDEGDRLKLGLPGYRSHSWRAGLDRLLLGYAMSDSSHELFNGILPFDDMEGSSVQLLGRLIDFVNSVGQAAEALTRPRPLEEWSSQLRSLLADFIAVDDETSRELAVISGIAEELTELDEQSAFGGHVTFPVVRSWVTSRLEEEEKGLGFMTGAVTFCAMIPMRSIPFKVIAMIGMNDGAFPRQSIAQGFDLIARKWRPGDRSLRDEDRYLFLETIMSARSCLYISYLGQSMRDNSDIPPSVLVTELLDAVHRGFTPDDGSRVEERLVSRHRLQAFSRQYFTDDPRLFSYSDENCAALTAKTSGSVIETDFMPTPTAEPTEEWRDVPLTKLFRFFANPARYFVEDRLGIRLETIAEPLQEREPFAADRLDSYSLKSDILEALLRGEQPEQLLPRVRSLGILPPADHGDLLFADHAAEAGRFAETVTGRIGAAGPLAHLDVELAINGFRLHGRLDRIWPDRMYRYRCAKLKARDQIRCWIENLLLNAAQAEGYPVETMLIMKGTSVSFRKADDAQAILGSLLQLYWQGLTRPLPFFPESAMVCATAKNPWDLSKASSKWEDGYNDIPGEGKDPYFRRCFGKADPFDAEFERVARIILEPLLQHQSKVSS